MKSKARLNDVCTIVPGGRSKLTGRDFVATGYPAFGAGGLNGYLPEPEFTTAAVVLSSIGARCGKCFLAEGEWTSLANTQLIFPSSDQVDVRFLWHQLNDEMSWHRSGTAQPFIKTADIKAREIFLPPVEEQRRISSILDAADELRAKRRESLALLDSLADSIFLDVFGDPITNPRRWPDDETLGGIANIGSGITKGRKLNGHPTRSVPYLAVSNVQDRYLRLDAVKAIDATESEIKRYRLERGDLLLTEGGDPDKLGRGTVWADELPECIHQNHIFRVRVDDDRFVPTFVSRLLGSERGRRYFLRSAKQTTGIASINKSQLSAFPMLRPPVDLQQRFVAQLDAQRRAIRSSEAGSETLDDLFASLQGRAFRGEL